MSRKYWCHPFLFWKRHLAVYADTASYTTPQIGKEKDEYYQQKVAIRGKADKEPPRSNTVPG